MSDRFGESETSRIDSAIDTFGDNFSNSLGDVGVLREVDGDCSILLLLFVGMSDISLGQHPVAKNKEKRGKETDLSKSESLDDIVDHNNSLHSSKLGPLRGE